MLLDVPTLGGLQSRIAICLGRMAIFKLYTRKYPANGKHNGHSYRLPSTGNRTWLICCRFLRWGFHTRTAVCRALTFASARLSCINRATEESNLNDAGELFQSELADA